MPITNEDISLDIDKCIAPLELQDIFFRPGPVQIEIGSGKGTFLLNQARAHPEVNYLGIEWANKYYRYSVDRMRRWQMGNVRILRADAREFIGRFLPDESVQTYHVYFPDPWPKKRHHKRRFFCPDTIFTVLRTLLPAGFLRIATDHADYFQVITEVLRDHQEIAPRFEQVDFYPTDSADVGEWVGSNFERKYLREGRKIYTLALRKIQ
ncbi:MAG: tRNA (guanosine(46)-N7)-methyltransferase TrmB [Sedimentisphaerales bacterium]|nr:tRNA (guanosine(46)-N7)-methyltransferase TrmB [Sedimentisphaerales bacterium]